jgi:hypothetical protein
MTTTHTQATRFVVALPGIGPQRFIVRGNAYPRTVARYDSRSEAQAMADKCPASYRAHVQEEGK